jgi:hypothetical protein
VLAAGSGGDSIKLDEVFGAGLLTESVEVGGNLGGSGGARDDRSDRGLRSEAGDRNVEHAEITLARVGFEGLDNVELLIAADAVTRCQATFCRPRLAASVLAVQQAARQGKIGKDRNPKALADWGDVSLDCPLEEVVVVLQRYEPRQPVLARRAVCLFKLGRGEVGATDRSDQTLLNQLIECGEGLRDGGDPSGRWYWYRSIRSSRSRRNESSTAQRM